MQILCAPSLILFNNSSDSLFCHYLRQHSLWAEFGTSWICYLFAPWQICTARSIDFIRYSRPYLTTLVTTLHDRIGYSWVFFHTISSHSLPSCTIERSWLMDISCPTSTITLQRSLRWISINLHQTLCFQSCQGLNHHHEFFAVAVLPDLLMIKMLGLILLHHVMMTSFVDWTSMKN